MKKTLLMLIATFMLATGSAMASTHSLTLHAPTEIGGTELKPGKYKMEINGEKLTITNGRKTAETTVKVEESTEKFSKDSIRYVEANGEMKVREIRVGGTNTRLVFPNASSNTSAQ